MIDFIKQYWLQTIFTAIVSGLTLAVKSLYSHIRREKEEQCLIKEGVLAILHDRIYQTCQHHLSQGDITVHDLDNLEYLYKSYHDLGGNGTGTELYTRCKSLHICVNSRGSKSDPSEL